MTMLGDEKRPGLRARLRSWSARHPLAVLSVGLIVLCWLLIYEVVRIVNARHTVAHDWAAGVLAGLLAGLVLAGVITLLIHRSRGTHKLGALTILIMLATVSVVATFRLTTSRNYEPSFRPTNWIEVAGMAYVAVFAASSLYLTGWAAQVFWRKRRNLRAGAAGPAAGLPADRPEH
jgi:drug/metabolite transporter (DMT)-like permease